MKRDKLAIIVHCWGGTPDSSWYPWLKHELERRGYRVMVPLMPNTDEPSIAGWTSTLTKILEDNPTRELTLIGHSIGCQAMLRALAASDIRAAKALFVAGWIELQGLDDDEKVIAKPWLESPIDVLSVRSRLDTSVAFFSNDDPLVPLSNQNFFAKQLGSQIVILNGYGHFDDDAGVHEIPELLPYL